MNYAQFLVKKNASQLIVGAKYAITDFQTIYQSNVRNSSGIYETWGADIHPSDIYTLQVTANSESTLENRAYIEGKDWIVEYDSNQETLPDGVKTKGKITWLRDEHDNFAFYDFKNVRYYRSGIDIEGTSINLNEGYFYTFSDVSGDTIKDSSLLNTTSHNHINADAVNNVFIGDTYNNIIFQECEGNTFLGGCHDSEIGFASVGNIFAEPVCYVTGSIYNKTIPKGDTTLSTAISKTIHKVNDKTIVSYLDPVTYAYQVVEL